jgi:LuxR family transcriptional regulator, maltose regulon positive regulatory protein
MPKVPVYTLAWSPGAATYELYETRSREALGIAPDSQEWFAWLNRVSSFAFSGKSGHYMARKEAGQRGDRYWSAYLATGELIIKKDLGKAADVTLARLEQIAGVLEAEKIPRGPPGEEPRPLLPSASAARMPPRETLASVSTDGEVDAAQRSQLDTPLHPLLATKLHVPRPRTRLVARVHLVERLQQGVERALTLISAPAGFGKTTLLAQWLAESDIPVAWLSLEAEDNDPTRFLSYLIAALQTLDAQIGSTALVLLRTPQPAPPETVLALLTNELMERGGGDFALVLDDYHVITAESIQRGMTFLLEHLPPQMHLILGSRADPPLPLARLRVQGQLAEMRVADLRFGAAETSAFLQAVMGLDLEASAIATLESFTEGWIVGLQLAALSLQGRTDISAFLAAFSGSHRFVLDYLSEEVLARQPATVQQFLLHTCILERLSGPLCDAVMGQEGSQALLEALEKANLFVVALDDERRWYRYHHLFAEMLRSHLQQREPTLSPRLHRRASSWYEQHELPIEAVQHALAIPDAELAAHLIEPIALPVAFQGQVSTVLGWLNALPKALIYTRPRLCVYYARMLTSINQLEAAEELLQQAERGVQEDLPAEQVPFILGWVFSVRAGIAAFSGDVERAISLGRQALALLPEAEVIARAGALVTTSRAYQVSGDVTSVAEREVVAANTFIRTSNNPFATMSSTCVLARLYVLQGRLRQAAATYEQVVQVAPRPEVLRTMYTSLYYYFGLGDLLREWNDLQAAERHLAQGMALVNETLSVEPVVAVLGYTALAHLQQARGHSREAFATLDALAQLAEQRRFLPHLLAQVAAVRAELGLAQGNLAAAILWADSSGLSAEDTDLSYPQEGAYLTLARVRIAQRRSDPATPFLQDVLHMLDRLQESAEAKARMNSVLEILVLRALALEVQGDRTSALSTLERALVLAAHEGYIRLFVDKGEPILTLLRQAYARGIAPDYVATLLSAFGEQHPPALPLPSPRSSSLLEPLTEREREVLHLLLEGASNREIARRLTLSVNTVKRHVYNICGKLGVQSRTQAIVRARALNLVWLDAPHPRWPLADVAWRLGLLRRGQSKRHYGLCASTGDGNSE